MSAFGALQGLDTTTLIRLAELPEAGLLTRPFGRLTIEEHVPKAQTETVAACLEATAADESPEQQTALAIRAFAAGREERKDDEDRVQIVWPGGRYLTPQPDSCSSNDGARACVGWN